MTARTRSEARLTELEELVRPARGDTDRPVLSNIAGTVLMLTDQVRELLDAGDAELAVCVAIEATRHAAEFELTAGIGDAERAGLGSIASSDEELARLIEYGRDKRKGHNKRRLQWAAMQDTANDLRRRHPEWSKRNVRRHVARAHGCSETTVRDHVYIGPMKKSGQV